MPEFLEYLLFLIFLLVYCWPCVIESWIRRLKEHYKLTLGACFIWFGTFHIGPFLHHLRFHPTLLVVYDFLKGVINFNAVPWIPNSLRIFISLWVSTETVLLSHKPQIDWDERCDLLYLFDDKYCQFIWVLGSSVIFILLN